MNKRLPASLPGCVLLRVLAIFRLSLLQNFRLVEKYRPEVLEGTLGRVIEAFLQELLFVLSCSRLRDRACSRPYGFCWIISINMLDFARGANLCEDDSFAEAKVQETFFGLAHI